MTFQETGHHPCDFANRRQIGPSSAEIAAMLRAVEAASRDALIDETVPEGIRQRGPLACMVLEQNEGASKRPRPTLPSDEAAEAFVEAADLTKDDWSAAEPVWYAFGKKAAALNMRIPQAMLDAVKAKAASKSIPLTCYVRILIEQDLGRS